jgi:hypothetical protein
VREREADQLGACAETELVVDARAMGVNRSCDMNNRSALSAVVWPSAMSRSTSRSRAVSSAGELVSGSTASSAPS